MVANIAVRLRGIDKRLIMPPRELNIEDMMLVKEMYATFQATCHKPESFSDFQRGFTSLLRMFEIKRRPLPYDPFEVRE